MASSNQIFSLEGKGLKLDTAEDIEPYIKELRAMEDVEEVRLLGNTLGIGASEALAKVLETKKGLKVCELATAPPPAYLYILFRRNRRCIEETANMDYRSQT
jgi:hypothetical protein